MTVENYIKLHHYPPVKSVGKLNDWNYYVQTNIPDDEDTGIPMFIKEKDGAVLLCTSDECLKAMRELL